MFLSMYPVSSKTNDEDVIAYTSDASPEIVILVANAKIFPYTTASLEIFREFAITKRSP